MKHTLFLEQLNGIQVERVVRDSEFSMPLKHMHPEYEIYFLMEGERYYFIENETYLIHEGTLVFISRNEIHRTGSVLNHSYHDRILISITNEWLNPFLQSLNLWSLDQFFENHKVLSLDKTGRIYIKNLLEAIALEIKAKKEGFECMIMLKMTELLLYTCRNHKDPRRIIDYRLSESGKHKKVQEITAYIRGNYQNAITLKDLSDTFFISKGYISRIFKDVTGFTITEYTNIQKVKYAQELLENSHFNMTQISAKAGFDSITYFEKIFKKYTGLSPMKYRKLHEQNRTIVFPQVQKYPSVRQ